jgi:hypothetical protein
VAQIYRSMERGERTAGSAGRLQAAEQTRKDEENKLAIIVDNASNEILTVLNNFGSAILRPLNMGANGVADLVKKFTGVDLRGDGAGQENSLDILMGRADASLAATKAEWGSMMDVAERDARNKSGTPAMGGR